MHPQHSLTEALCLHWIWNCRCCWSSRPWLPRCSSVADCHVFELYVNSRVHQTCLNAKTKEELAIPNLIPKCLLTVVESPKSGTPIAMLTVLLSTWVYKPDWRSEVKGNVSNKEKDESELWKCVCPIKAMLHHWAKPKYQNSNQWLLLYLWNVLATFLGGCLRGHLNVCFPITACGLWPNYEMVSPSPSCLQVCRHGLTFEVMGAIKFCIRFPGLQCMLLFLSLLSFFLEKF